MITIDGTGKNNRKISVLAAESAIEVNNFFISGRIGKFSNVKGGMRNLSNLSEWLDCFSGNMLLPGNTINAAKVLFFRNIFIRAGILKESQGNAKDMITLIRVYIERLKVFLKNPFAFSIEYVESLREFCIKLSSAVIYF